MLFELGALGLSVLEFVKHRGDVGALDKVLLGLGIDVFEELV